MGAEPTLTHPLKKAIWCNCNHQFSGSIRIDHESAVFLQKLVNDRFRIISGPPGPVRKEILGHVLDKGVTADFVKNHLANRGAADTKLCVLATKQTERLYPIDPDYVGFDLPDVWLVGMGMDDGNSGKEFYRWNDAIIYQVN